MGCSKDSRPSVNGRPRRFEALWVAVVCSIRRLPLLAARHPKTALRVWCVAAFDTLEVLTRSTRLTLHQVECLCWFLDFAACANARSDGKKFSIEEFDRTRQHLEESGYADLIRAYLTQLQEQEENRPSVGPWDVAAVEARSRRVRNYRESVARLSLQAIVDLLSRQRRTADLTDDEDAFDEPSKSAAYGAGLELLFHLVMLCQLIDDALDYGSDRAAGLPSFLTAAGEIRLSLNGANAAVDDYVGSPECPEPCLFPFQLARSAMGQCVRLLLAWCGWWHRPSDSGSSPAFARQLGAKPHPSTSCAGKG